MTLRRSAVELIRHAVGGLGLRRTFLALRRLRGEHVAHLYQDGLRERFTAIYRDGIWLNGRVEGSRSGLGSEIKSTEHIRRLLPVVLRELETGTLLDVGCGDFTWMKEVALGCAYVGVDIVPAVVDTNTRLYASETRTFKLLDATTELLPSADTVLCREVLFHLSFEDGMRLVSNVQRSGAKHFVATTDPSVRINANIDSGDFRLINLQAKPYCFPSPRISMPDNALISDRLLGAWAISELPIFAHE